MTKLILLGGFLGSGKTTFMVKLGAHFESQGYSVSVISNDQGDTLVDTFYSEAVGLDAAEVSGGCFCCRFPDFLATIEAVIEKKKPDIIIAEAVGSCTDLAATVINPLIEFHSGIVQVQAFLTLVDGMRLQGEYRNMNLSEPVEAAEVLISHQIREAGCLVLSKTDLLDDQQKAESLTFLKSLNPEAELRTCSSVNGEGLDDLAQSCLDGLKMDFSKRVDIDYQVYADAEAAYGWYNGSWLMKSAEPVSAADLSFDIMDSFHNPELGDVAHAKLFITTAHGSLKVSFVMGHIQADEIALSHDCELAFKVILNIRSACSPDLIEDHVLQIHKALEEKGFSLEDYEWNALVPSAPKPYYS